MSLRFFPTSNYQSQADPQCTLGSGPAHIICSCYIGLRHAGTLRCYNAPLRLLLQIRLADLVRIVDVLASNSTRNRRMADEHGGVLIDRFLKLREIDDF